MKGGETVLKDREEATRAANATIYRARRRREISRRAVRIEREWGHEHRLRDLHTASRRITEEIAADSAQARSLTKSRAQAVEGKLISQEELDRALRDDDE